ncbi:hypothetical protein Q3G72_000338 [Acer saccharum]|nr:hypothetical protein Q3G72_000338 [Acer saccharum]
MLLHKNFAFKADSVADDGTFSGYGSVFGNKDSYDEIVAPGAFTKSLSAIKSSGDPLPVLWQHDQAQPIGGYTSLEQDDHGLKVEGFLLRGAVARADEAYALMKARVVKGLSIGYYVPEGADSFDKKTGVRTLHELDLREISVVTFPANGAAQVESVKSTIGMLLKSGRLPNMNEFEDFLREAGFSKTQAVAVANGGLAKLLRGEPGDNYSDVLAALRGFKL